MRKRTILLVEDDPDDIFFMQRAVANAGIDAHLRVAEDGEQAIAYLSGRGEHADRPLPSLILLDLKIPRRNGLEVLEWIRGQPELTALVVIVLTSSRHNKDVVAAARRGANSFLVKPPNVVELSRLMTLLKDYWWEHDQLATAIEPVDAG